MQIVLHTFEKVCILVTLTLVLTSTRGFARLLRPRLARRDQIVAFLIFLFMALTEEAVAQQSSPMNARIIAACAGGLLVGPVVGAAVGMGAGVLAWMFQKTPPAGLGIAMVLAGLAGGVLRFRAPNRAQVPLTGFALGALASLFRYGTSTVLHSLGVGVNPPLSLPMEALTALVNGGGVALILLVINQVRDREVQARATALAEVRALQARMNPHFLFNALNTVAALAVVNPQAVPAVVGWLSRFLRASLDWHDRSCVPLADEMAVVDAYLEVESLRFGDRLRVERQIAGNIADIPVPPFILQPLVENAVLHGIQASPQGGTVRIDAHADEHVLHLSVWNTGVGMAPPKESGAPESLDLTDPCDHALSLLRRRLRGLYGSSASLTLESVPLRGTTALVQLPLKHGGL